MRKLLLAAALFVLFAFASLAFADDPVMTAANADTVHQVAQFWRGAINDVVVSSDESLMAVGAITGVYIYNLKDRSAPVMGLPVDGTAVKSVEFDSTATNLAAGTDDGKIYIFSTSSGSLRAILDNSSKPVTDMLFTNSPFSLLVASEQTINVWSMADFQKVTSLSGHSYPIKQLASADGGNTIVSLDYQSLHFWDNASFFPRNTLDLGGNPGANAMAFNPAKPLAIALALGTDLEMDGDLSVAGGDLKLSQDKAISSMAFSPDGRFLASTDGDTIMLRKADDGTPVATMFQGGYVGPLYFSPDGARLYAAGNGAIVIWDTTTGKRIESIYDQFGNVNSLSFSADGRLLAVGNYLNPTVTVFDAATLTQVAQLSPGDTGAINAVTFSPDSSLLAVGGSVDDNAITLWDTTTFKPIKRLSGHTEGIRMLSFAPNGTALASFASNLFSSDSEGTPAAEGKTARLWSIPDGALIREWTPAAGVAIDSGLFTPDGSTILTGSADKIIRFWNASTGENAGQFTAAFIPYDMAMNPQGNQLLYSAIDSTNFQNLTPPGPFTPPYGYQSATSSEGVFGADGNLVAASADDKDIKLFDLSTGNLLATLTGHTDTINTMVFNPDGTRLVSTGLDGRIRVWAAGGSESTAEPTTAVTAATVRGLSPANASQSSTEATAAATADAGVQFFWH